LFNINFLGNVTYQTEGFLEKNKDFIVPEHISMMESSSSKFIQALFAKFWADHGVKTGASKGSGKFKNKHLFLRNHLINFRTICECWFSI
jgi:myosin-5